jgi:hypothetical protein
VWWGVLEGVSPGAMSECVHGRQLQWRFVGKVARGTGGAQQKDMMTAARARGGATTAAAAGAHTHTRQHTAARCPAVVCDQLSAYALRGGGGGSTNTQRPPKPIHHTSAPPHALSQPRTPSHHCGVRRAQPAQPAPLTALQPQARGCFARTAAQRTAPLAAKHEESATLHAPQQHHAPTDNTLRNGSRRCGRPSRAHRRHSPPHTRSLIRHASAAGAARVSHLAVVAGRRYTRVPKKPQHPIITMLLRLAAAR